MYFITAFGLLMMFLSVIMITNPQYWSDGIVTFSTKPYFHWFEVISRLASGIIFVIFHAQTLYPSFMLSFGYLLVAVAVGLVVLGEVKHRKFALWSAIKFKQVFRISGVGSFVFGIFLVYVSTIGIRSIY